MPCFLKTTTTPRFRKTTTTPQVNTEGPPVGVAVTSRATLVLDATGRVYGTGNNARGELAGGVDGDIGPIKGLPCQGNVASIHALEYCTAYLTFR